MRGTSVSCCGWRARRVAALISCLAVIAAPAAAEEGAAPSEAVRATPSDEPGAPDAAAPDELAPEEKATEAEPGEESEETAAPVAEAVSPYEQYAARAFDVFPIRLLSACASVVGFGAFLVSVPLVGPVGRLEAIRNSWEYFVIGPVDYTFVRPLGEF